MQRKAEFLNFSPAHQAAASYILAINLSKSPVADHVGLKQIDFEKEAPQALLDELYSIEKSRNKSPLALWTPAIQEMALLSLDDLSVVYSALLTHLNVKLFDTKLSADKSLWIEQ